MNKNYSLKKLCEHNFILSEKSENSENMFQKHQPEIPENQLINRVKNPNYERSENITKKLM